MLAVTKDVESYKYSPDEEMKRSLLHGFLRSPPLFAELLDKYSGGLPSDANLRYELIQRGFSPSGAESVLAAFRRSVEFSSFFDTRHGVEADLGSPLPESQAIRMGKPQPQTIYQTSAPVPVEEGDEDSDRIPVRLPGGRKAWLVIPTRFFASDKDRLKAQIDLLLTAEDDEGSA
ncbi:hypothetical protein [Luteibacter jiangsuensis]